MKTNTAILALSIAVIVQFASIQDSMGQTSSQPLSYEVATIKAHKTNPSETFGLAGCRGADYKEPIGGGVPLNVPRGRCIMTNQALKDLVYQAFLTGQLYSGSVELVTGGPSWVESDKWDVEGKAADPSSITEEQLRLMLQQLLKDRFGLEFHRAERNIQGYALVPAKSGPKVTKVVSDQPPTVLLVNGNLVGRNVPWARFVDVISGRVGAPVIDRTKLSGNYDFSVPLAVRKLDAIYEPDDLRPSILTVVEDEFGLLLTPQKLPIEGIVIDHADKPTEN